ncbi:TetR/AcrR family transcriptional regulator [Thermoleophilia bacterium SCSIO 60948]|nr:TetR/AcrR family transcriptional regulator [Thermoleophilia bacterium SCSIO 60948]
MLGQRRERADAAENRRRILEAARRLLRDHGAEALTMQAVAEAAGVGKGTVFHRFGSRDGLTEALIDDYMRDFQDRFLRGAPPLGPGAPPRQRLEAFVSELVRLHLNHLELAVVAEGENTDDLNPASAVLAMHIVGLLEEIDPTLDAGVLAGYLLSATSPGVLHRLRTYGGVPDEALERAAVHLLRGLTGAAAGAPG